MLFLFLSFLFLLATPTSSDNSTDIQADVVLIIDVSASVSDSQRSDLADILQGALTQFTIDKDHVNIAVISVLGDLFPTIFIANPFKSIAGAQGFVQAIVSDYDTSALGSSGTGQDALFMAMEQLTNNNFLKTGYRNGTQNHLALYATTTSSPNQDAIDHAAKIMEQNVFQFMAVGYQGSSNLASLQALVGGSGDCGFVSFNKTEISTKIAGKLLSASNNGGTYC